MTSLLLGPAYQRVLDVSTHLSMVMMLAQRLNVTMLSIHLVTVTAKANPLLVKIVLKCSIAPMPSLIRSFLMVV